MAAPAAAAAPAAVHELTIQPVRVIEGHVKLAAKDDQTQSVSLRWLVKSPTGKVLGDVKQANDIPAGSLDGGWGGAATAVAEAAATGIFDVVKRYR
mgnify:CR=1 FL=1